MPILPSLRIANDRYIVPYNSKMFNPLLKISVNLYNLLTDLNADVADRLNLRIIVYLAVRKDCDSRNELIQQFLIINSCKR